MLFFRSWLVGAPHRSEGGLIADQLLDGVPGLLWELACQRWRTIRHIHGKCAAAIASRLAPTGEFQ